MQNSNQRSTRLVQISLCLLCQFAFLAAATLQAYATNGLPQSKKFGFGARIDPDGVQVDYALAAAVENGLNWIAVDFDWSKNWPSANSTLDLADLDHIMSYAIQHDLSVLLSVTNPPQWASTKAGPDPQLTAGLVAQFWRLYPQALKAVELFPAANTQSGWGAPPDPAAYAQLFEVVSASLKTHTIEQESSTRGSPAKDTLMLVAAGLVPVSSPNGMNMDDLAYLKQLYSAGAKDNISVLSVRLPSLTGDPLADPHNSDAQVLRHYELIRGVMLDNGHSKGLIWITGFTWPTLLPEGSTDPVKESSLSAEEQAQTHWLNNAHQQMKSQLYLGAAIYNCLNPSAGDQTRTENRLCLISVNQGSTTVHPALASLGYINTLLNRQQTQIPSAGPGGLSVPIDSKATSRSDSP